MTQPTADPVLAAILSAAMQSVGARQGLLLRLEDRILRVVASRDRSPGT